MINECVGYSAVGGPCIHSRKRTFALPTMLIRSGAGGRYSAPIIQRRGRIAASRRHGFGPFGDLLNASGYRDRDSLPDRNASRPRCSGRGSRLSLPVPGKSRLLPVRRIIVVRARPEELPVGAEQSVMLCKFSPVAVQGCTPNREFRGAGSCCRSAGHDLALNVPLRGASSRFPLRTMSTEGTSSGFQLSG